ncbi:MAG: DNA repair protein RecO [Thermodesulfobacteriota bacterium]
MEKSEAIIIKKSVYGESDYLVTLFTKKFGKVKVLARSAKKSKKRFGGRLEPFLHLNADITFNENKFNILNDITLINAYSNIMESLESFAFGSFILEHLEIFTFENQMSEELFNESINTFEEINSGRNLLPELLKFQIKLLEINGIKPDFNSWESNEIIFDITDGSLYGKSEKKINNRFHRFAVDIVLKPALMEIFLKKVADNIKVLTKYIEQHTERNFNTSKFLEEIIF